MRNWLFATLIALALLGCKQESADPGSTAVEAPAVSAETTGAGPAVTAREAPQTSPVAETPPAAVLPETPPAAAIPETPPTAAIPETVPASGTPAATPATPAVPGSNPVGDATAVAPASGQLLGSCAIMEVTCSDYYGPSGLDIVKGACQSVGKWSDAACPTGEIQGTCTKSETAAILSKTHSYPPATPDSARQACANTPGGVFSAR